MTLDRLDLIELEDRDADLLAAERADQFAGHEYAEAVYVPTEATLAALAARDEDAARYRRRDRREALALLLLGVIAVAWVAFLTAAYLLLEGRAA